MATRTVGCQTGAMRRAILILGGVAAAVVGGGFWAWSAIEASHAAELREAYRAGLERRNARFLNAHPDVAGDYVTEVRGGAPFAVMGDPLEVQVRVDCEQSGADMPIDIQACEQAKAALKAARKREAEEARALVYGVPAN
ncbi:hypothetical protein [Caulobacter hibisci]|uniref:Uncharacterized protein n=1 Tax=Caulobacter hibisci TaxID=2035993 RepID=A0ABS0SXV4_9CAUL|nr:hypothetical protein [Caulobacter hibisci]MBI1684439.1 hypothetical protein [Caulobacter hibisci]